MILLTGSLTIGSDFIETKGLRVTVDGDEQSRVLYEAIRASIMKMNLDRNTLYINLNGMTGAPIKVVK